MSEVPLYADTVLEILDRPCGGCTACGGEATIHECCEAPYRGQMKTAHVRPSASDSGLGFQVKVRGRGTARAEDAQGAPTQSHISPSIL